MKIKDLIKELEKFDQETRILVEDRHMEQGYILLEPNIVIKESKSEVFTERFVDAFDGTPYTSNVERESSNGKKILIIRL